MSSAEHEPVEHAEPEVHMRNRGPAMPAPGTLLFRGLTGSHAYGLAVESSDEDWRGVFATDTTDLLGLRDPQDTYHGEGDVTFWEIRKYLNLLIKGSVNAHELLWLPEACVDHTSPLWDSLRSLRASLFSRRLYDGWMGVTRAYGYELAKRGLDWPERGKHAMHMLRFASGLEHALRKGEIEVRLSGGLAESLRRVREGTHGWEARDAILTADETLRECERLWASKPWPEHADEARLSSMLTQYRLASLALPC